MTAHISNVRPEPDKVLTDIVDYVRDYEVKSDEAYETARYCLLDTLGCGLQALDFPACTKLLGPLVPGLTMHHGARVPGTSYELDPVQAAFNIGTIIRWLDYNDTWLAAEWGHPSDNLGAILATADWLSRNAAAGTPAVRRSAGVKKMTTASRHPEMPGQQPDEQNGQQTAPPGGVSGCRRNQQLFTARMSPRP